MHDLALDILVVLLILTNLRLLGSSRLAACIRAVALQAVLLGAACRCWPTCRDLGCPRWSSSPSPARCLKAGVLPWLLRRAVREAGVPSARSSRSSASRRRCCSAWACWGCASCIGCPAAGARGRGDPAC